MKKLTAVACFVLVPFSFGFGQIDTDEIDKVFSDWNQMDVPGAALGVIKDGVLVYSKGYGSADLEHSLPIKPSSVFYIGSVSKQFVTFCVLLLEEQGKIGLDDPIQKYLPDFPEYGSPLTIRHFIHHTSGVRDYLTLLSIKGRNYLDNIEVNEVYELIKSQEELNFQPGEKYLYSNSCYFMLAMIVEIASGQSIRDYADENIFSPLGMENTLFYDDNRDLIMDKVFSYLPDLEGEFNNQIMRFDLVGSGGVYSNVEDLYKWDQNFYDNKLGKGGPAIIDKMHIEGLLNNGESSGYAFALNNGTYRGLRTVSHGGALAGYRAQLMRFPDQKFSVIVLANRGDANPTDRSFKVADIVLKDSFADESETQELSETIKEDSASKSDFQLNHVAGNYRLQPGVTLKLTVEGNSVHVLQNWNNVEYNILKKDEDSFIIFGNTTLEFIFSELEEEQAQKLTIIQNGNESEWERMEEFDASTVDFTDYEGNYYSKELDAYYRIFVEDDMLKVRIPNTDIEDLNTSEVDRFILNGSILNFKRGDDGAVSGFEMDAGRVQNLKFNRQ